jgi:ATP-dependent exoDNAse (exonuclease V) beta subunit
VNPAISAFLEWWESDGLKKSVLLPEQQDSMKILTIHKSKGLEFGVVILPFLSWNVDHKSSHSNIMWVTPGSPPYNKVGILPVRYKSDLADTIFAGQYFKEKYSAYLDNINLLYVAFTRAVHAIFGFAPDKPTPGNRIAAVVKDALNFSENIDGVEDIFLYRHFDPLTKVFEYGTIQEVQEVKDTVSRLDVSSYPVNENSGSLKLKLHWENYFSSDKTGVRKRINYGRMMHEIFSEIITADDINEAVRKRVLEGKIPEAEEKELAERINVLIERPPVKSWFEKGNEILNEVSILMPDSLVKRPDRVILKEGYATIIDFKFGGENQVYVNQIRQYKRILTEMGYSVSTAYLWYVDADKIIPV